MTNPGGQNKEPNIPIYPVRVFKVLPKRFARFGLKLHPDKTKLIFFSMPPKENDKGARKRETFNFLGFTFYWGKSRKGNWTVIRKTAKYRMKKSLRRVNDWCMLNRHLNLLDQTKSLNLKLRGHYNYFGITGNICSLRTFRFQVHRIWKKWLCRRSNLYSSWSRFNDLTRLTFVLASPKIYHSIYAAKP